MKKILIYVCLGLISMPAFAQQKPHYTQYILNQYIINPALTGIENYVDVKASHRQQWVGIQDAPVTTYFTIHGPIGKSDMNTTATSQPTAGENPRGKNYWEDYVPAKPHHGWGVQIINDRTGPFNQFSAYGTYAYHLGISAGTNLSAGIGVGVNNISLNADKLRFYTAVDPAVYSSGYINNLRLDMNAGLYLYSADYFVGLSVLQLVPSPIDFSNNTVKKTKGKFVPHVLATAGYRFLMGEDFNFLPSIMVKYLNASLLQVEGNGKLMFRDRLWIGGSYRHLDGIAAMVGINVSNSLSVGYAYDYTTSRLNNYTKGTHEILVGFTIGNKFGDTCPRNVW